MRAGTQSGASIASSVCDWVVAMRDDLPLSIDTTSAAAEAVPTFGELGRLVVVEGDIACVSRHDSEARAAATSFAARSWSTTKLT